METFSRGTLDPLYVTGFVEGNGSFTYSRSGKQLAVYFAVKLPEADRDLLEDLQRFFSGIGRIYGIDAGARRSCYFRVSHRAELVGIVDHFDAYPLRTRKREAYAIWKQMVAAKQHFRDPDREQLEILAAQLSALSG